MRFLVSMLALLTAATVAAADVSLSLSEAQRLAREHSHRLRKAAAEAESARFTQRAARAERLPTLSLASTAQVTSEVAELSVDLPAPLGIAIERQLGDHDRYQNELRLALPLFTGGRIGAAVERATAQLAAAEAMRQASEEQLTFAVRSSYLGLMRADYVRDAADAARRRAVVMAGDIEAMYKAGTADSLDLLEVRLVLADADFAVAAARAERRSAEIQLQTLLGLPLSDHVALSDSLRTPALPPAETTVASTKPEYRLAQAQVALGQSGVRAACAEYLPTLAAFGAYAYGKPNVDYFGDDWNSSFTAGINLSWSFNLGLKAPSADRAARRAFRAAEHERDRVVESLGLEANLAVERLGLAFERHRTAEEKLHAGSDEYRLAREKHLRGDLSSNRLLEIEARLTEAEATAAAARADYYLAQSRYYYAVGSGKLEEGF